MGILSISPGVKTLSELPGNIDYQPTEYGGHMSFIGNALKHLPMWLEHRVPTWLSPFIWSSNNDHSLAASEQ
jgi:uncharacterized protein